MPAFRRKLVVATLGLGACSVYDPSVLSGYGFSPPIGGAGGTSSGRADGGSSVTAGVPGASGTPESSGGRFAGGGAPNQGGAGRGGVSAGSSGRAASGGDAAASGDGNGGEAGIGQAGSAGEAGATTPSAGEGGKGDGETCTGCARLSVPLTSSADRSHFVIALAGAPDFTDATVHYRVFLHAGTTGQFTGYLQDTSGFSYEAIGTAALSSLVGWQDLSWVVTPTVVGFDPSDILMLGIEISGDTGSTDPTVVYVDSIAVPSLGLAFDFDDAGTVLEGPQTEHLTDQKLWLNADSEAGSTLTWLGP
jgi:hypothetical protein